MAGWYRFLVAINDTTVYASLDYTMLHKPHPWKLPHRLLSVRITLAELQDLYTLSIPTPAALQLFVRKPIPPHGSMLALAVVVSLRDAITDTAPMQVPNQLRCLYGTRMDVYVDAPATEVDSITTQPLLPTSTRMKAQFRITAPGTVITRVQDELISRGVVLPPPPTPMPSLPHPADIQVFTDDPSLAMLTRTLNANWSLPVDLRADLAVVVDSNSLVASIHELWIRGVTALIWSARIEGIENHVAHTQLANRVRQYSPGANERQWYAMYAVVYAYMAVYNIQTSLVPSAALNYAQRVLLPSRGKFDIPKTWEVLFTAVGYPLLCFALEQQQETIQKQT
jgi:hypothetical protein